MFLRVETYGTEMGNLMADDIMFLIDSTAARKPKYQEMAACCRLGRELFNKEVASTSSGYSCLPTLCGTTMFHWIFDGTR